MNRKRLAALILAPVALLFLTAQISAPPVYSPKLGIGGAPPTANGDLRVYGNFQLDGTCVGCPTTPVGGSNTQVQYNNAGALGGDAGLTYDSATDALTVAGSLTLAGTSVNNTALFTAGTLGVARGGTGISSYTAGNFINALDASTLQQRTPAQTRTAIAADPGGSDTQVQFNSSGNFGGDAGMTYNAATDTLTVGAIVAETSGNFTVTLADGCTVDTTLSVNWVKLGTLVMLSWDNMSPNSCTGDSINWDSNAEANMPSSIRPTSVRSANVRVANNGLMGTGQVTFNPSGTVQIRLCAAEGAASTTGQCSINAWTNSGTRGLTAGSMAYSTSF